MCFNSNISYAYRTMFDFNYKLKWSNDDQERVIALCVLLCSRVTTVGGKHDNDNIIILL
jgi:hypothetical protein